MVCHGDSRTSVAVWDVYECCEAYENYVRMDRGTREYEKWTKSNAYEKSKKEHQEERAACNGVRKLTDCIRHFQKRMGTALRDLKKKIKG